MVEAEAKAAEVERMVAAGEEVARQPARKAAVEVAGGAVTAPMAGETVEAADWAAAGKEAAAKEAAV